MYTSYLYLKMYRWYNVFVSICAVIHVYTCTYTIPNMQCCIQLAQGKLSPDQLTDEVISLVSTHSPRHLSDLSLGVEQRGDSRPSVEILRMMQKLSDRAKHAQQCCSLIMTCFKIAVVGYVHCVCACVCVCLLHACIC